MQLLLLQLRPLQLRDGALQGQVPRDSSRHRAHHLPLQLLQPRPHGLWFHQDCALGLQLAQLLGQTGLEGGRRGQWGSGQDCTLGLQLAQLLGQTGRKGEAQVSVVPRCRDEACTGTTYSEQLLIHHLTWIRCCCCISVNGRAEMSVQNL